MTSTRRPPLAGRIASAMCLIVCLNVLTVQLLLILLGADIIRAPISLLLGIAITCTWLAIAPPRSAALAFLPALTGLACGTFVMLAGAHLGTDQLLDLAVRRAASEYSVVLAMLLIGLAVITRRTRICAEQPQSISVYSVLDRESNARELWVASTAFLSAGIIYLATAILAPAGSIPLAEKLIIGLVFCAIGIAVQELWGYVLIKPDTFRCLMEQSQPILSGLRMTGWLVASFMTGLIIASAMMLMLNYSSRPFAAYIWIGAGGWLGVAYWIRREFFRMEKSQATARMLQKYRAA